MQFFKEMEVKVEEGEKGLSFQEEEKEPYIKIQLDSEAFPPIRWQLIDGVALNDVNFGNKTKQGTRSWNMFYKKMIQLVRKTLLQIIPASDVNFFELKYDKFKTSRCYFFFYLAYAKTYLNAEKQKFQNIFTNKIKDRIAENQKDGKKALDQNVKRFNEQETSDLTCVLMAFQEYMLGNSAKAVDILYRRGKPEILKKYNCKRTTKLLKLFQNQLQSKGDLNQQDWQEQVSSQICQNQLQYQEAMKWQEDRDRLSQLKQKEDSEDQIWKAEQQILTKTSPFLISIAGDDKNQYLFPRDGKIIYKKYTKDLVSAE